MNNVYLLKYITGALCAYVLLYYVTTRVSIPFITLLAVEYNLRDIFYVI